MSLTSDQTARIKSSVKAKLVDIGAYVDDQLSDYVMIMITNKKTEKQMTEDLELFLGGVEQAASFSSWLHSLIKKTLDSNFETPSKTSSHHHHHHSHKKSSSSSKSSKSKSSSSVSNVQNISLNVSNNDSDELAIQIDSNEFNDDFNEDSERKINSKNDKKKNSKEFKSSRTMSNTDKESVKCDSESRSAKKNDVPEQKIEQTVNPFTKLVGQEMAKESEKLSAKSNHSLSSKVTLVTSKVSSSFDRKTSENEEEFDKKRLSSVVKVTDRKSSIPKSMQPNKSILFKAVDAANSSVRSASMNATKSFADEKLEEIRLKRFGRSRESDSTERTELFTASYRASLKPTEEQRIKRLKKFENSHEVVKYNEPMMDQRRAVLSETEQSDSRKIISNEPVIDRRNIQIESTQEMESDSMIQEASTDEPKFIVTMTGLENNQFIKNLNKTPQKRTLDDMNDDFEEQLDYDEEINEEYMEADEEMGEADEELQKRKLTRCSFWPMCDKGDQCQYLHPNKPCTAFPNCTYGNLCHYLHPSCRFDGFCTRTDCPYTHVIRKPTLSEHVKHSDAILDGKTEVTAAPGTPAGTAPTITINKIQSTYYKKNIPTDNQTMTVNNAMSSDITAKLSEPMNNTGSKFVLSNVPNANSFSQVRMPRAATQYSYFKSGPTSYPFGSSPYSYSNQYSFVNRAANPTAALNRNCKYGNVCQNPKCAYVHPNLPQKSQLKWTAALSNTTNLKQGTQSDLNTDNQSNGANKLQESSVNVANNSMIIQSS